MTLSDFIMTSKEEVKEGWFIAELSDEYIVDRISEIENDKWKLCDKEHKVTEIRAFNKDMEHKLFRTNINKDFQYRVIKDNDCSTDYTIEEEQMLDIDTDKSRCLPDGDVFTTGGGRYHLPLNNRKNARVKIKYYLERYKETGQARVVDWRVVGFVEG